MQRRDDVEASRFDRRKLLRFGTAAALPLALGKATASAASYADVIPHRLAKFAALEKRGVVAWWPTWGGGYFYRPGRMLTTTEDLPRVAAALRPFKAKRVVDKATAPVFESLGVVEFALPTGSKRVPLVLADIARTFAKQDSDPRRPKPPPAYGPHYVTLGEPQYDGGPFGPPSPADPQPAYNTDVPPDGPHVAVIDTGYFWGVHADLDAHVPSVPGAADAMDAMLHDSVLDDEAAHGTFITGIIVRLAPTATVEILKVLNGLGVATEGQVADAIEAVARRPEVDVINLSLGAFTDPQHPPVALARAIAKVPGTTAIVAAAGNNHKNQPMYPAAFTRVVAVAAAADRKGTPASFTNFGPWVDCYAPGQNLTSAFIDWSGPIPSDPQRSETFHQWARWSGTSFAAPKVSGAIAAMVGPTMTAQQAADALVHDPARPYRVNLGRFLDL
jgi:hypothetical protein